VPNPQSGGPSLDGCKLPSIPGGRLLHPQPEDAPCHDKRDPANMDMTYKITNYTTQLIVIIDIYIYEDLPSKHIQVYHEIYWRSVRITPL
jgi:hypothetical protein